MDPVAPTTDWSGRGDSGSLVFSQEVLDEDSGIKPAVGLHFAGAGDFGIACKIQNVFSALDLTTLSAGAFAAFFDGMFEAESTGAVSEESEGRLRAISALAAGQPTSFAPHRFVRREHNRPGSLFSGMSSELFDRVGLSHRGQSLRGVLGKHQAELLLLLLRSGDVRRATVAAFRPLMAGATTTTDVLERILTAEDLKVFDKLAAEVSRGGSDKLSAGMKVVQSLWDKAEGKSLAEILNLEL